MVVELVDRACPVERGTPAFAKAVSHVLLHAVEMPTYSEPSDAKTRDELEG
jgi:hypothetical protein